MRRLSLSGMTTTTRTSRGVDTVRGTLRGGSGMVGLRPSRAVLPNVLLRLVERRGMMRCRSTESGQEGVRVRFAPSPTGNLHVGGARTALYNYLYAQQKKAEEAGSAFVLRVEDTDKARSTKESEDAVLRDLTWLGLDWDEGPLRQSERGELYQQRAKELLEKNLAYKCFCTDDEITAMKEKAAAEGLPPVYSGKWASATEAEVQAMVDAGEPYAVRFRVPQDELVTIQDAIRGDVTWNTNTLGDFIILRSDGTPVYNFCVAVDDADMKITEVVRAEEHLPNTLRQVLIYNALGLSAPKFAHCSLILAPDRSKLSKRHGATSVGEFKEEGYLSEALVNYLALLGWNDGTEQEFFTKDELVSKFSLERINPSAAIFDKKKLNFFNAQYIKNLEKEDLAARLKEVWLKKGFLKEETEGGALVAKAADVFQENLVTLNQSIDEMEVVLSYPLEETLKQKKAQKVIEGGFYDVAKYVVEAYFGSGDLKTLVESEPDTLKAFIKTLGKDLGVKGKNLFLPVRICLTGKMQGPDVGDQVILLMASNAIHSAGAVSFEDRMKTLKQAVENAVALA